MALQPSLTWLSTLIYHRRRRSTNACFLCFNFIVEGKETVLYNKLSRNIRDLAQKIRDLDEKDGFRAQSSHRLLEKLYSIGLIPTKQDLSLTEKVTASSFCRRRLPSIMLNLRMAQNLKTAITFIEQGHVRVGPDIITDPAFLVTRNMEDFVTWVDSSKIKQHVMNYNEERDDFDLVA
uniref:U3 small nucleolar ribonucleoprotein protein IMP3 isoform X2 n=1 Tax=Scatophagus argus TaxID=75038 RepID=UPI001ED80A9B|nr:U3 small nucleolar ribonucleoprotein protein IMP3 isoform X2 [Scatophagus argus]